LLRSPWESDLAQSMIVVERDRSSAAIADLKSARL